MGNEPALFYAATSGDILNTYLRWRGDERDEDQVAETYSGQFFALCRSLDRPGVASFPDPLRRSLTDGEFRIWSVPPFPAPVRGIRFHLVQFTRAVRLMGQILGSGASDIIVMDGVTNWILLSPLRLIGRRIYVSVHTLLWRADVPPSKKQKVLMAIDGWFLRHVCSGCLVVSEQIADQMRELARPNSALPIYVFRPLYERQHFADFSPPDRLEAPFRIFFAGRVEENKGVFDLLKMATDLRAKGRRFLLDICGEGGAREALHKRVRELGLQEFVIDHGHLERPQLLDLLGKSHVVVVPTRSSFQEGLNKVVVEAVLARRPVVTSSVCPAIELVREAALEAEPDNPDSYRAAIEELMDNPQLFQDKLDAGESLREQFFNPENGWKQSARKLLALQG